jgi:ubiquitin carboxyl-terminal hydrolase 10
VTESNGNLSSNTAAEDAISTSPVKEAPKSWADLLRSNAAKASSAAPSSATNGTPKNDQNSVKGASLGEALTSLSESGTIAQNARVAFLEPRGLVNTGNMCYMNSVS